MMTSAQAAIFPPLRPMHSATSTPVGDKVARDQFSLRLEAFGRLACGVVHDLNNLLTVIVSASEALSATTPDGSIEHNLAETSLLAATQGAELVSRLMRLATRPGRPQSADCDSVVGAVQFLARHAVNRNILLKVDGAASGVFCKADAVSLETVLLNLCINAGDAMTDGGTLTLTVSPIVLTGPVAGGLSLDEGDYVAFTVADTGHGMSAQTLRRCTDAFFTTKGDAGSGLGLSGASDFAANAGGALTIASVEAEGTQVSLYLPIANAGAYATEAVDPTSEPTEEPKRPSGRCRHISR